jgi:hypothetical protein
MQLEKLIRLLELHWRAGSYNWRAGRRAGREPERREAGINT